jgi:hypothetical protein
LTKLYRAEFPLFCLEERKLLQRKLKPLASNCGFLKVTLSASSSARFNYARAKINKSELTEILLIGFKTAQIFLQPLGQR